MGALASLDWAQSWPNDSSLNDLPHCKISWKSKVYAAIGDDFSFWIQTLLRGAYSLGFGRNLTSMFLIWCSNPL